MAFTTPTPSTHMGVYSTVSSRNSISSNHGPSHFNRSAQSSLQPRYIPQPPESTAATTQPTQVSTKALAITSSATGGTPPPPLMGSAIVLANDSAIHCFGGRLENRELTNCHYVLDVETCLWETVHAAPLPENESEDANKETSAAATASTSTSTTSTSASAAAASSTSTQSTKTKGDEANIGVKRPTGPEAYLSLTLTTDPADTDSGPISGVASLRPRPRYFHTLNAFGTSLVLFGGMGKIVDSEADETKEQNGNGNQSETAAEGQGRLAALNDLWVFDITTQRWHQKILPINAHTPRPRWAHMATILDHYLVVIGGQTTNKEYVEDACVLDLHSWEWVASIHSIGQCGSYRTVAATGPSKQSTIISEPAAPSFPSAYASSPQSSAKLARPLSESGPVDAMASISMVLSGRISAPSSVTSSSKDDDTINEVPTTQTTNNTSNNNNSKRKNSERLMSDELTPAFKTGKDGPSIYLYSNYNFQNLQRDFKIITPYYSHPLVAGADSSASVPTPPPSFSLVEKSQALAMMGPELPPGLRFPQGHVYQNQLILTGTLIQPGKAPVIAIYALNLALYKWEQLATDSLLETGSWNRTLLHPATGTLLVFGKHSSDAEKDYASRMQHHDHLMLINLQAYGLYDRPIPSLPQIAQDLGQDLLFNPSLSDMHIASATGTLFNANSGILSARWPEFTNLLLSPPYVTPLILILPVPDEVVPLFLQYLYTGALPMTTITAGMADYLLILARKYELNGLYALIMDILHQTVHLHPIRIYGSALMAGELGLQARAVSMAIQTLSSSGSSSSSISKNRPTSAVLTMAPAGALKDLPPVPASAAPTPSSTAAKHAPTNPHQSYSGRVSAPLVPVSAAAATPAGLNNPYLNVHHSIHMSRESLSTDGGFVQEGLLQQYNGGQKFTPVTIQEGQQQQPLYLSSPDSRNQRSMKVPSGPGSGSGSGSGTGSGSGSGSNYTSPMSSPGLPQAGTIYQTAYPSPLSPAFQQSQLQSFSSQQINTFNYDDYPQDERALEARRRLQLQMQQETELLQQLQQQQRQYSSQLLQLQQLQLQQQQLHSQQQPHHLQQNHQEYLIQQQLMLEQQQMREQELMLLEQQRLQHQRYLQSQHRLKAQQLQQMQDAPSTPNPTSSTTAAMMVDALDYHFGGGGGGVGVGPAPVRSPARSPALTAVGTVPMPMQMQMQSKMRATSQQLPYHDGNNSSSNNNNISSGNISGGKNEKDKKEKEKEKKKEKKTNKVKPPKQNLTGAELMRSAGF